MNKTHGGNIWKIAKENGLRPEDIIDFSASINPLGPSPRAMDAIKRAATLVGHYPEPQTDSMKSELAFFHKLPEENILAGNGSTQFIYLIPQVLKPKTALLIEPAFSEYRNSLIANHCTVDEIVLREENDFCLDRDRLFDALKKGYDILYMGNPANPTGILTDKKAVVDIATECRKHGTILIVDEAFIDFVEEESVKAEAVLFDNLIVLRSMTKFFAMPGLRLGYVIAHENIIRQFEKFMPPWSVNSFAGAAGMESLRDKDYIRKTREMVAEAAASFLEQLHNIPYLKTYPIKANYLFVKALFPAILAGDMQRQLLKNRLLIRDCGNFIGLNSSFFRVAVKSKRENRILIDAIKKLLLSASK